MPWACFLYYSLGRQTDDSININIGASTRDASNCPPIELASNCVVYTIPSHPEREFMQSVPVSIPEAKDAVGRQDPDRRPLLLHLRPPGPARQQACGHDQGEEQGLP